MTESKSGDRADRKRSGDGKNTVKWESGAIEGIHQGGSETEKQIEQAENSKALKQLKKAGKVNTGEWKKKLEEMDTLQPEPERRRMALGRIREAALDKKYYRDPSFPEILWGQLRYISPVFWLLQGLILIAAGMLFKELTLQEVSGTDYMAWFSMITVWFSLLGVWELGRHLSGRMAELEQSCYINLSQLWAVKLCLFGAVDFLLIIGCCMLISGRMEQSFLRICIYLLVPYELAGVGALQLLSDVRKGNGRYLQIAAGIFLGILAMLPASIPRAYDLKYLWVWFLLLLAGGVLFVRAVIGIYGKIEKGEILCWN